MKKIGADILLESLASYGVDVIFGYPGGANMPLYDKLENFAPIKHILVRNEQGAAFAAQGVARSTKRLGVALGTSGPGASNLITGIMDAYMDSIPVLFITGQVAYNLMGNDVFQEMDVMGATLSMVKHSFVIKDVNQIPKIVEEAVKIATSGRPGPVLIDFPKDVILAEFNESKDLEYPLHYKIDKKSEISGEYIKKSLEMINKAKKPILLIGQGVKFANAENLLSEFVNKLNIPTVSTLLAKGVLHEENKNYLGMLGMHGFYHANQAIFNADLIINIGSRFDDRIVGTYASFGKNAEVIHIDTDKSELNKLVKAELSICASAYDFLGKILKENLKNLEISSWRENIESWKINNPYEKETIHFSIKNALNSINKKTNGNLENYIVCTDVGQHQMWSAQILKVANTTSWLTSGGAGTMGFAIPTAMGASYVNKDKTVLCIVGDGSVQMNIQELQVLFEQDLNVKVIIMNNSFLGMVRQWQDLFFEKNYASTPIGSPDYVKLADAYRIRGYRANDEKSLEEIINKEFDLKGPAVIEVVIKEFEDNIFPMVPPGKTLGETILKR